MSWTASISPPPRSARTDGQVSSVHWTGKHDSTVMFPYCYQKPPLLSSGRARFSVLADLYVAFEEIACDDEALNLVGAVEDAEDTHLAIPALDGQLFGVAHAAVDLEDAVHHFVGHVRAVELRHGRLVPVVEALIGHPRRPQRDPLRRLYLNRRIRNHPLDSLAAREWLAEGSTVSGMLDGHVEQPLRRAHRPRRNRPTRRADPA